MQAKSLLCWLLPFACLPGAIIRYEYGDARATCCIRNALRQPAHLASQPSQDRQRYLRIGLKQADEIEGGHGCGYHVGFGDDKRRAGEAINGRQFAKNFASCQIAQDYFLAGRREVGYPDFTLHNKVGMRGIFPVADYVLPRVIMMPMATAGQTGKILRLQILEFPIIASSVLARSGGMSGAIISGFSLR